VTQLEDDPRLQGRFLELREGALEAGRVPDFDSMWARAKADAAALPSVGVVEWGRPSDARVWPNRRVIRVGAWATAALAAALTGLILLQRPSGEAEFEQLVAAYASDAWQSPTSGLLEVPGIELTRSVPSIGGPARGLDPSTRPNVPPRAQREDL
jgi:hypothetical protein